MTDTKQEHWRGLVTRALALCDGLADQQAMPDDTWKAEAAAIRAAAETRRDATFEVYDERTASALDRIAWTLCQIIDDDAPLRWTRYRFAAECIARNPRLMIDLKTLSWQVPR